MSINSLLLVIRLYHSVSLLLSEQLRMQSLTSKPTSTFLLLLLLRWCWTKNYQKCTYCLWHLYVLWFYFFTINSHTIRDAAGNTIICEPLVKYSNVHTQRPKLWNTIWKQSIVTFKWCRYTHNLISLKEMASDIEMQTQKKCTFKSKELSTLGWLLLGAQYLSCVLPLVDK